MAKKFAHYVFHTKLAGKRVCVKYSPENGIYADELEEFGIWEKQDRPGGELAWTIKYPLSIVYHDSRWDMEVGHQFTMGTE